MRTYYKINGYHTIIMHTKKGWTKYELIDKELKTASELQKLEISITDLPSYIEKIKVKDAYWSFGARFEV